MTIRQGDRLLHWNYFLALESDVAVLSRFIEFSRENFKAYSLEMTHLLLASASEADVVSKLLCKVVDPNRPAERIHEYRNILNPAFPTIKKM